MEKIEETFLVLVEKDHFGKLKSICDDEQINFKRIDDKPDKFYERRWKKEFISVSARVLSKSVYVYTYHGDRYLPKTAMFLTIKELDKNEIPYIVHKKIRKTVTKIDTTIAKSIEVPIDVFGDFSGRNYHNLHNLWNNKRDIITRYNYMVIHSDYVDGVPKSSVPKEDKVLDFRGLSIRLTNCLETACQLKMSNNSHIIDTKLLT